MRKKPFYLYLFWFGLAVIFILLKNLSPDIFASNLLFLALGLYLLILPGWLLAKLLKFSFDGLAEDILSYFVLSLSFYLIINLFGIFLGLKLENLLIMIAVLIGLMFVLSLVLEFRYPQKTNQSSFSLKNIFIKENILFILPIIFGIIIFLVVAEKGADYNGDPYYHLAIMRKAISDGVLSLKALSFTKTSYPNPAYAFPAWHIFLAEAAKITSLDIFTLWSKMLLPLTMMMFFSWYFLAKNLFCKKNLTLFAFAISIIFIFNINVGYLFQRLPVPDTLSQYILLPLAFGLAIKYIFNEKESKTPLIILALVLLLLLMIHGLHYFYFLLGMVFFALMFILVAFKDNNFRTLLKRIVWVFGISLGILSVLAIILEFKTHLVSQTLKAFRSSTDLTTPYVKFSKWSLPSKWALIIIPLVVLFFKNRRLIFIVSLFLLVPLVYFTPLQYILSKNLSYVFTARLGINLLLYYFPIALILGFVAIILERIIRNISPKIIMMSTLFLSVLTIINLFLWRQNFAIVNKIFYLKPTAMFLNDFAWLLFVIVLILTLLLWVLTRTKPADFWSIGEFKYPILGFLIMFIFWFSLFSYSYNDTLIVLKENHFFAKKINYDSKIFNLSQYGGDPNVISFINNNIPPKSVILANSLSSKILPLLTDQYMAYSFQSIRETSLNAVLGPNLSFSERKEVLFNPKYQIDYVYLATPEVEQGTYFNSNPEEFELIYNNKVQIYKLRMRFPNEN